MSPLTWLDHALALTLGLVVPALAVLRHQPRMVLEEWDRPARIGAFLGNAIFLWLCAGAVLGAGWWAGRDLTALGLAPPGGHPGWSLALAVTFLTAYAADTWWKVGTAERRGRSRARWLRDTPFMPRGVDELPYFSVLAVSAGVSEELVYRGFLISYLTAFTGAAWPGVALAVGVPALIFAAGHRYQGWGAMLHIGGMAIAFGALFVYSGSVLVPIALHVLIDLVGGPLGVWVLSEPD